MKNYLHTTRGIFCLLAVLLSSFLICHGQGLASIKQQTPERFSSAQPEKQSLSELLEWAEDTYKINLSYDTDLVGGKHLTVKPDLFPTGSKVRAKEVENALKQTLAPFGLSVKRIEKNYYLVHKQNAVLKRMRKKSLAANGYSPKLNQTIVAKAPHKLPSGFQALDLDKVISGKITDELGGALPGVNIFVKNTTIGTVTDFEGNYSLSVPDNARILIFSFVGYKTREVEIGSMTTIDLSLEPDISTLEEVVVVGYGTQQKRDLTGSIVSVKGEELTALPVPRVEEQLKAKVAGLSIANTGYHPGGTVQIRLRGNNSIEGNNSPLIVIDGMIGADLFHLNPNDIESVEVLKDASATAIYGARGANGVIIVTTKKGEGAPTVNFDVFYGLQEVPRTIDLLNAQQFTDIFNQNNSTDPLDPPTVDTDWQDEIYEVAPVESYQLSVSGGNDKTSYLFSSSYYNQKGVIPNSDFERVTIRLNLEQEISERFTIGNNLSFSRTRNNLVRMNASTGGLGGNPVSSVTTLWAPVLPVNDPVTGDFQINIFEPNLENPMRLIEQNQDLRTDNYLFGNFYADYRLVKGLTYRLNLGYVVRDNLQQNYEGRELVGSEGGTANVRTRHRTELLVENTLTYQNTFAEKHDFTVLGGFTTQEINRVNTRMQGRGFSSDDLGFDAIELAQTIGPITTGAERERIASVLGRINYSFAGKYLLTASFRADGASVFAANNKWGYFPSASVGWNISEEGFMSGIRPLSNLKLRLSYGTTGSPNIDPFQSLASFQSGRDYAFGEDVFFNGALPQRVANNDLKWESTTTFNIGLDVGLFEERVQIAMEYYDKETTDLHYDKELPDYTGFNTQTQNVGSMSNKGFEFSLNSTNLNRAVTWNTNFNIFFNRNEVLEIGDDFQDELILFQPNTVASAIREASILREGEALGSFYGFIFDGIYQNQGEIDAIDDPGAAIGGVKFRDTDGDGDIDLDDRVIIGSPQPDFQWGLTNNFTYKNFDLSFTLQAVQGVDIFWITKYNLLRPTEGTNLLTDVLDYWTPENGSNTMQALDQEPGQMSDRFLEDGSYVRLQNLSLGYTLPKAVLDKMKMSNLRFYFSAQNLWLITDYAGYDPEVNSRGGSSTVSDENLFLGIDQGAYPGVRTFTVGVNATF